MAAFDTPVLGGNGDGVIDKQDAIFSHLCVWIDRNHNGVSEPSEILSLDEAHIVRIELSNFLSPAIDRYGNEFRYLSITWVQDSDGRERPVLTSDVYFVMRE